MNIPTEFVRVQTAQDISYTLMVSLMPARVAENILGMSSIPAIHAIEPIYRLISTLTDANKINGALSILEKSPANTTTVENYLESNLH